MRAGNEGVTVLPPEALTVKVSVTKQPSIVSVYTLLQLADTPGVEHPM